MDASAKPPRQKLKARVVDTTSSAARRQARTRWDEDFEDEAGAGEEIQQEEEMEEHEQDEDNEDCDADYDDEYGVCIQLFVLLRQSRQPHA